MVPRECQGSKSLLEKFVKPVIEVVTSSDVAPGWGHVRTKVSRNICYSYKYYTLKTKTKICKDMELQKA